MKNARVTAYTPDAIREAGEIIAAAIKAGGGSGSVSWDQIVLTGSKIAEITINGEVTEVYAPNSGGSGSSVSWNEIQLTGVKIAEITIDGTTYEVYAPDPEASDIDYDNSTSGLVATDVQAAIDEVYAETSANTGSISDLNTEVGAHDTAIGNLQTAVSGKANESIIAPVEASLTASRSYAIGEQFIYAGTLYTATANISAGGTITIDGNCTASDTVTEQIHGKIKLLWENSDPSASFAGQQISIANYDYDLLLIIANLANGTWAISNIIPKGSNGWFSAEQTTTASYTTMTNRSVTYINETTLQFSSGYKQNSNGSRTTDNTALIPYRVYGIKI